MWTPEQIAMLEAHCTAVTRPATVMQEQQDTRPSTIIDVHEQQHKRPSAADVQEQQVRPATTKAERRARQEAEREAKAQQRAASLMDKRGLIRWESLRTSTPEAAWQMLSFVYQVEPLPLSRFIEPPPKAPSHVRFVCISDTHSKHTALTVPAGDVLLHTGDFSHTGRPHEIRDFCDWLAAQPHPRKILIAGNHDLTMHSASYERTSSEWSIESSGHADRAAECAEARALIAAMVDRGCEYLCDSGTTVDGLRVWGAPWQPRYAGAFNLQRGPPLRDKWRLVPDGTDVLLTHSPPLGHGDLTASKKRAGCLDLLEEVTQRISPRVHCFGHIHEGHGVTTDGTTTFVNASSCTRRTQCNQQPLVFDLPARPRRQGGGGAPQRPGAASCATSEASAGSRPAASPLRDDDSLVEQHDDEPGSARSSPDGTRHERTAIVTAITKMVAGA